MRLCGRNPLRSWARSNAGLRMMFGFDSVCCWDSGTYGAISGAIGGWKVVSQAWLDGAWDVAMIKIGRRLRPEARKGAGDAVW